MHLGTARTAYFNWLIARASGGRFILRIDDANADKNHPEYVQVIIDTMLWLGLDYDVFFKQSDRLHRYLQVAEDLVCRGAARMVDDAVVLLRDFAPKKWHDEIGGEMIVSDSDQEFINGLFVLMRSNYTPTYHFASVVDDLDFDINYVVRGVDHISNTARQLAIYNALGRRPPKYAHIGLLHHKGKKVSKRDGAASMLYYQERGYDPDAVLNFMLRMGWSPAVDDKTTAVIDRVRALRMFMTEGKMRSSPANVDLARLESYDRKYKARKGVWRNGDKLIEV